MWLGIKHHIQSKKCSHHDDASNQARSTVQIVDEIKSLADKSWGRTFKLVSEWLSSLLD
jgi:hypothetical protein